MRSADEIAHELVNFEAIRGTPGESNHTWAWHRVRLGAEMAQKEAYDEGRRAGLEMAAVICDADAANVLVVGTEATRRSGREHPACAVGAGSSPVRFRVGAARRLALVAAARTARSCAGVSRPAPTQRVAAGNRSTVVMKKPADWPWDHSPQESSYGVGRLQNGSAALV